MLASSPHTWGLVVIVVGVLAGLGIYVHATGPVGEAVRRATDTLLGAARLGVPVALVVIGYLLAHDERRRLVPRVVVGATLALIGVAGFAHLVGQAGSDAGGWVGRGLVGPLRSALATPGAAVVLTGIVLGGLLAVTGTSLPALTDRVRALTTTAVRRIQPLVARIVSPAPVDPPAPARSTRARRADDAADGAAPERPVPVLGGLLFDDAAEEEPRATPTDPAPTGDAEVRLPAASIQMPTDTEQLAIDLGPAAKKSSWKLPSMSLLKTSKAQAVDRLAVEAEGRNLERALAAHGVDTRLVGMTVGPTVTRFELELGPGVKVARVTSLHKDIAYAMASPDVRILAPIPGRSAIGVEVPNRQRQLVALGDVLSSAEAREATHPCAVAVGRDISGRPLMVNLAEMPHLLIAGATGAGKSSAINSMITSLLMRSTPDQLRLILIDPKRVELGQYNGLPHLLTQVVVDPKKAANALSWATREMDRRYELLEEVGVRDIISYNESYDRGDLARPKVEGVDDPGIPEYERLDYIVIVVDELNDLMMVAARDVEDSICRIAQKARAVGMHLVIATQRPSVNVITGVIKANVPARMAFAVSTATDSRVILDTIGAERLVGKGDMLLIGPSSSIAQRIQGPWVSEDEVRKVVAHWRRQAPAAPATPDGVIEGDGGFGGPTSMGGGGGGGAGDDDDLLWQAMDLVVRSQLGSTSMLQRKLKVGFARAGRLMDLLEQRGVVGPSTGSKARDVLMTVDELDALQGPGELAPEPLRL